MAGIIASIAEGIAAGTAAVITEHVITSHTHDHTHTQPHHCENPNLMPGPSYIPPIDFGHTPSYSGFGTHTSISNGW
jgi:hypothetical protein